MPDTQPPRRGRRWVLIVVGLLAALGLLVILANPSLPKAPELDGVSLELPGVPPASRPLAELLRATEAPGQRLPAPLEAAAEAVFKEGRWPRDPAIVQKALDDLRSALDEVRGAVLAPGCLPQERPSAPDQPSQRSFARLVRGLRLLSLQAVLRAEQGAADLAARELFPLFDRLVFLEQDCAPDLVAAVLLGGGLQQTAQAFGFILAQPGLEGQVEVEIWRRLLRLEQRHSPLPDAVRWAARRPRSTSPPSTRRSAG